MADMLSVVNNLFMLKNVIAEQVCNKCKQPSEDRFTIGVCHHTVCQKCADSYGKPNHCPECNAAFDPEEDISSYQQMKLAISQMENIVYLYKRGVSGDTVLRGVPDIKPVILTENNFRMNSNVTQEAKKKDEELKSSSIKINGTSSKLMKYDGIMEKLNLKETEPEKDFSQLTECNASQSSTDLFNCEVQEIQLPEKSNYKELTNDVSDQKKKLDDFQEHSMNDEQSSDCGSSKSEKNVIEGTPERVHISNLGSSFNQQKRNIVISCSNFDHDSELEVVRKLVDLFKLEGPIPWSDNVTHLVIKTSEDGRVLRTTKFMNALLSNCYIVTIEWVNECLRSNNLLPEFDYMPLDKSGEPSPLVSWRVGAGIFSSPMDWTEHCTLYFHSSVEFNDSYSEIIGWAKKAGFVIINDVRGFINNESKMRIILADTNQWKDNRAKLPSNTKIISWLNGYKAVTLFLDWLLECLSKYRFVKIDSKFQIMKLDPYLKRFVNMDESLIEY